MNSAEKIGLLPGFGWITGHNFWVALVICIAITPIGHLVVGFIGESRFIPITPDKQYLSFFPGDLFLGVMTAGLLSIARDLPNDHRFYNATWWHVAVLCAALVVAVVLTYGEWKSGAYPTRAIFSPSKLFHNGVLYVGYGYVIVTTLVAVLANARTWWLIPVLLPGLVWVWLVKIDNSYTSDIARYKAEHAHIDDWRPIWRH